MIEKFRRDFWGKQKKKSRWSEDERHNPRKVYENNLFQEILKIENLPVPVPMLQKHLIDTRDPHHYGARCLVLLSVGKQTRKGDDTIINIPKPWQHLIGGEKVKLSEDGIKALEKSVRKFEEAYGMEKLKS